MLIGLLKSFLGNSSRDLRPADTAAEIDKLFLRAETLLADGQVEAALVAYKKILVVDPYHLIALNQSALCLGRLKRNDEAGPYFERAALIDDSFAPALVNFAIHLKDSYQSRKAERYLTMAQKIAPASAYVDGVMGALQVHLGQPHEASVHQLNAWLKGFDNHEFAHNYLFNYCFSSDPPAEAITAEHLFWAETMAADGRDSTVMLPVDAQRQIPWQRKIRVGYLSGDFRKHSVRFFFRPLLENHDRERFEVYGYYDMSYEDEQTRAIESRFDHFRRVANLPDVEVVRTIRDDELDVLVDLTGHTSISRIHLFRHRLAALQLTALGYPPTTGLANVDYKVVDAQAAPDGSERLYAERLMRLPTSFWCFNPLEPTPAPAPPPALHNGHITFGCFGNIAKISRRVLACWALIMGELPEARLVLKAITFKDEEAKATIQGWLESAGIDFSRVSLVPPDEPEHLYAAFADIDIILDTHPFNGGTTSCFALWMAVPIITLEGEALISRMGSSMLSTLGLDELVARTDEDYVRVAVGLARDTPKLIKIRSELRQRMLDTPLGNGALYAREFEQACEQALEARRNGTDNAPRPSTPVLSEKELIRRAQFVQQTGQPDAAARIVDYCLMHYPASVGARIVRSSFWEQNGQLQPAHDILSNALDLLPEGEDRRGVEVNLARLDLQLGRYGNVQKLAAALLGGPLDALGRLHVELYQLAARNWAAAPGQLAVQQVEHLPLISVIVHCDDDGNFAEIEANLAQALVPGKYELLRTSGEWCIAEHLDAIAAARGDILLFVRPKIQILSPLFHADLARAIGQLDIVGCAGASQLAGTRWFDAGFPYAHGAIVLPNSGPVGGLNLSVYGPSHRQLQIGLKVLDDSLFAVRKAVFERVAFDQALDGDRGLCELDWFVRANESGFKLGAAPVLGVARLELPGHAGRTWYDCAALFRERYGLADTSEMLPVSGASVLLPSLGHAMPLLASFYDDSLPGDA